MKITAPLLLLPLLLAACGTQSTTPTATGASTALGRTVPVGPTYIEAFEAGVQRDLTALGLSGSISAQATAPKSYLNVLKVSDTTARAYIKTTYSAETGCVLDWGDGTATATITTPSVVATDKADHTYIKSGTYTVKLTCGNDVKTSTFAAVVPIKNLGLFETYTDRQWAKDNNYYDFSSVGTEFNDKNFYFRSNHTFLLRRTDTETLPISLILLTFGSGDQNSYFRAGNNELFNLDSITASGYYSPAIMTGYDKNNQIVGSVRFDNIANMGAPLKTETLNWKNLSIVRVTSENPGYLNIDDMAATILDK